MPISFDLEKLREKHNCVNYFETGLWDPRDNVSSKHKLYYVGLKRYFVQKFAKIGLNQETTYLKNILWRDDSSNMKKYLMTDDFKNKTIFFLDAHVDNANIKNYKQKCPLFDELEAIKSIERKDNLILIDDLRIITKSFPWGEQSYGDIDFLQQIKNTILTINKDYKFDLLNGHIQDDILLAYI